MREETCWILDANSSSSLFQTKSWGTARAKGGSLSIQPSAEEFNWRTRDKADAGSEASLD